MKAKYALLENLPFLATISDIDKIFSKFAPIDQVHLFQFKGEYFIYDIKSAIIVFSTKLSSAATNEMQTEKFKLCNEEIKVTILEQIDEYEATAILYDINPKMFKEKIQPTLRSCGSLNTCEVTPQKGVNLSAYVVRFISPESIEQFIKKAHDFKIQPLITPKSYSFNIPKKCIKSIKDMTELFDFYLMHCGKKYGVIRSIARSLSKTIDECESDSIDLPDMRGPIEMITDYLLLQDVIVTPETEQFLYTMASFLRIDSLLNKIGQLNDFHFDISNAAALCSIIQPNSLQYDKIIRFIASNIDDLIENKTIEQIPYNFAASAIERAAPKMEIHDPFLRMITALSIKRGERRELLKFVNPHRISNEALCNFIRDTGINLNKIRPFLLASAMCE